MQGSTWGGSEELWGRTALEMLGSGHQVAAAVIDWPGPAPRREALAKAGCQLWVKKNIASPLDRVLNRFRPERFQVKEQNPVPAQLLRWQPDLVVISQMFTDDGLEWMEFCTAHHLSYVTVVQAATEYHWPDDGRAMRLRLGYLNSLRACFVSRHNLKLTEMQIAAAIPQSEIVWSPFAADCRLLPWPGDDATRLACVGRLQPDAKGQDVLVDVLSRPEWKQRGMEVTFYGYGANQQWLRDYCVMKGLTARFGGFADVGSIWGDHHLLVHPARKEGMPIVVVEAALCGRPVVATATAGIRDFVQDGVSGFLCSFPEERIFAAAMERAWENRAQWQSMGEAACARTRSLLPARPEAYFAERLVEWQASAV